MASGGGAPYYANRPLAAGSVPGSSATTEEWTFGPVNLERAVAALRTTKTARNLPMMISIDGKVDLFGPEQLKMQFNRAVRATQLAGTNNNDPNVVSDAIGTVITSPFFTSEPAWGIKSSDSSQHGLVWLDQMPLTYLDLGNQANMSRAFVATESYVCFAIDAHGVWATAGA